MTERVEHSSILHIHTARERLSELSRQAFEAGEEEDFERAIALNYQLLTEEPSREGRSMICFNLGNIFSARRERRTSVEFYELACLHDPSNHLAFNNLDNIPQELEEPDRARKAYELAIPINPHYSDAHFNLGVYLDSIGEFKKALEHFKTYLRLDTTESTWADKARTHIVGLERHLSELMK